MQLIPVIAELWNSLRLKTLARRAAVVQKYALEIASAKKFARIRKCLRRLYLQTRGEVAEGLKAAVC